MSLTSLLNQAGTILTRTAGTAVDAYGNAVATEGTTSVMCNIQQVSRSEPGTEGEMSVTEWKGFFPTGTSLDTSDVVVVGDATYEVIGDPWDATMGSAAVHHLECTLKKAR
jgi:hypothetical protein